MKLRAGRARCGGLVLAVASAVGCTSPASKAVLEPAPSETSATPDVAMEDDADRWWNVLESLHAHGMTDERSTRLRIRLDSLGDPSLRSFVAFYVDRLAAVQRASLLEAASETFGGCDPELFAWLTAELVFRGRAEYERAGLVVFPSEHGLEATRRQMLLYTLPLVLLPLVLARLGVAGMPTVVVGTGLGLVMLGLVLSGLLRKSGAPWARKVFFFTLVHLSGLFAVLAVDRIW